MSEKVTVIVGAGVMGISTALAARRKHPDHTIYLINDGQQSIKPASEDIGKIIRDAYNEEVYAKLAAEATKLFQSEPIYEDLLHQSGWVVLHPSAEEQSITGGPLSISKADFLKRFPRTRLDNINRISEDPKIAWVEASKALQATVDLAKTSEIILEERQVVDLLWDGSICAGVILGNGIELRASSILLAMGHETTSFLEQCKLPDMGGERVGISLLGIQLSDEQYNKYKGIPILLVPGVGKVAFPYWLVIAHHTQAKYSLPIKRRL
jgi:glycine/D-amino acid oxidase-like deaminating enzyme